MKKFNILSLTRIPLAVAFLVVGAKLSIPIHPPISMQTLCIFITSVILNPAEAFIAGLLYLLLGILHVPVFSNGLGVGFGAFLTPSGGFLISFPFIALLISILSRRFQRNKFTLAFTFSLATVFCYIFGAVWIRILVMFQVDGIIAGVWDMLKAYILPFILIDPIKIYLAVMFVDKLGDVFKNDKKRNKNNKAKNRRLDKHRIESSGGEKRD